MTASVPERSTLRRYVRVYRALAAHDVQQSIQYQWPTLLGMLALLTEPVVYLVVWNTVADANGGSVGGLTRGEISAYYIVLSVVRYLTAGYAPIVWEFRLREGMLSDMLLRPVHPAHNDLAAAFGYNLARNVVALPLALLLALIFRPSFDLDPVKVVGFVVAVVGAYVLRGLFFALVGMVGFWTTRTEAASRVYLAAEVLLSGRLVPIVLFPGWLALTAQWLPLRYTFGFPIEVLTTPMSFGELAAGLARLTGWLVVAMWLVNAGWRRAVRRFDAVGI